MPEMGVYTFKPRYPLEMVQKVLEAFTVNFLDWNNCGAYFGIETSDKKYDYERISSRSLTGVTYSHSFAEQGLPEGYVRVAVYLDEGNMDEFSEVCFSDQEVTGYDLAEHMFVLLQESLFWEHLNPSEYTFEDGEFMEILMHLAEPGSRTIAWCMDEAIMMCHGPTLEKLVDGNTQRIKLNPLLLTM